MLQVMLCDTGDDGSGMEVQLDVVTSDSEHYVWLRNGGAVGCCYRQF
jgi:hypothetical protein